MSRCDDPECIACVWSGLDDQVWIDYGCPVCLETYKRRNAKDFILDKLEKVADKIKPKKNGKK